MNDFLQEGDGRWAITCTLCGWLMCFAEVESCRSAHKGKHPHIRCTTYDCPAHLSGTIVCLMVRRDL